MWFSLNNVLAKIMNIKQVKNNILIGCRRIVKYVSGYNNCTEEFNYSIQV